MSKTVLAQVDGFTPLIDAVVLDVGIMSAAVFGKAWRYCQMSDGVCKAGQERIADELGISRITVNTHFAKLVEAGYLKDITPTLLGLPHTYVDTGKAGLSIIITGEGVKNIDSGSKKTLQEGVKNIDSKKELKKEKKGSDIFGFMAMSEDLKANQNMDEIEQIVVSLETGLRFNFPRGTKDQAVYRRILKSGKPVERFIEWVKSDEKRLSYAFLYAKDTETIWRDWPQVDNVSMNPQGLEIGL